MKDVALRIVAGCAVAVCGIVMGGDRRCVGQELDPRFANFRIDGLLRFDSLKDAECRRDQLVHCLWKDGLPSSRPHVIEGLSRPEELAAVDQRLIARVDRYACNVSGMNFESLAYVAYPALAITGPRRLAIVHGGHMREGRDHYLDYGLKEAVDRLLANGCVVAIMQMPLVGWNRDDSGTLPDGREFQIVKRSVPGHDEMFAKVEPTLGGRTMTFFLEPVVQVTNELLARHPDNPGVLMIGLSGGGWTTHFSASLDPRILYSIPVAGALPLYARPFSPGSKGDAEQEYPPILREIDTDDDGVLDRADGVCSWLEIFALGGIGPANKPSRKQMQVINFEDSCCFGGPIYQTYEAPLTRRVSEMGSGEWGLYVDRSHRAHVISERTLDDVLMPFIKLLHATK